MKKRKLSDELQKGIRAMKAHRKGKITLREFEAVSISTEIDVRSIRERLNFSQAAFASLLGISVRTVQDWEQGRRQPQGPARALLLVAREDPKAVRRALGRHRAA